MKLKNELSLLVMWKVIWMILSNLQERIEMYENIQIATAKEFCEKYLSD